MPYILPTSQPRQTFWDNFGSIEGTMTKQAVDVLLAALTKGAYQGGGPLASKNIPNPNYGASSASSLMPGASLSADTGGLMTPPQNPQQIRSQSFTRPTVPPFATQPMLNAQQFQALQDLQKYKQLQSMNDPNSPTNQFLTAQAQRMSANAHPSQSEGNNALASYLAKRALEGDEEANTHLQALGY